MNLDPEPPPAKKPAIDLSQASGTLPTADDSSVEIESLTTTIIQSAEKLHKISPRAYSRCYSRLPPPEAVSSSSDTETASETSHEEQLSLSESTDKNKTFPRKFVLIPEYDEKEYYECEFCHDKRKSKTFSNRHLHGKKKIKVRWFCPICGNLYAVTHRGYHIRHFHTNLIARSPEITSEAAQPVQKEKAAPVPLPVSAEPQKAASDVSNAPVPQNLGLSTSSASLNITDMPGGTVFSKEEHGLFPLSNSFNGMAQSQQNANFLLGNPLSTSTTLFSGPDILPPINVRNDLSSSNDSIASGISTNPLFMSKDSISGNH